MQDKASEYRPTDEQVQKRTHSTVFREKLLHNTSSAYKGKECVTVISRQWLVFVTCKQQDSLSLPRINYQDKIVHIGSVLYYCYFATYRGWEITCDVSFFLSFFHLLRKRSVRVQHFIVTSMQEKCYRYGWAVL